MIKAVTFSYMGGPRQGSEIVIDDEKNIDARIEELCHRGVRHYEHTDPVDVPLERIKIMELRAKDLVNLIKLGVQEQYEEQFARFTDKFKADSIMQEFQFEHDTSNENEEIEKLMAQSKGSKHIFKAEPGCTIFQDDDCRHMLGTITAVDCEADEITYIDDNTRDSITVKYSEYKDRVLPF